MGGFSQTAKVSIHSIAVAAGTSVGTVSNVINHPERVRPALRARVELVMREMHFRPDATARALKIGRSPLVGTVFFDISNPFFAEAAHEMDKHMQMRGSSMIVAGTEQRTSQELSVLESLERMGVDGLIITSMGGAWDVLARLQEHGLPILLFAHRAADERFEAVGVDDYQGMKRIAEHVCKRGMTRFCFINDTVGAIQHRDRWKGFVDGVAHSGLDPERTRVEWVPMAGRDQGYRIASAVLAGERTEWPECFICLNDYIAMGASKAIQDAGLQVGIDIGVTGFDDVPYASLMGTPLTTIRQPVVEMSEYVTEAILGAVERGDGAVTGKTFDAELIVRESA